VGDDAERIFLSLSQIKIVVLRTAPDDVNEIFSYVTEKIL